MAPRAVNWIPNAPGTQLANALQTDFGIQASSDAWFGGGNTAGTFPADDSRLSINSAWTPDTTYISIGGPTFKATAAGTLAFTPVGTVKTFRIFYLTNSGAGTISANIDGGSATTQSTSGSAGMGVFTLTASSVGSHTVNVTWASGGQVNIVGIEAYDSTQYRVLVDVLAVGGANRAYLASTTYAFSPGNALPIARWVATWFCTRAASTTGKLQSAFQASRLPRKLSLPLRSPRAQTSGSSLQHLKAERASERCFGYVNA